jgi:hypothetical protein
MTSTSQETGARRPKSSKKHAGHRATKAPDRRRNSTQSPRLRVEISGLCVVFLKEVQDNNLGRRHEIEVAFPPAVLHVARLVSPLRYWNWLECPPDEAIDVPGVGNVGVWSIGAHALTVTGSVEDSSNINQSKKCSKAGVPLPKPT